MENLGKKDEITYFFFFFFKKIIRSKNTEGGLEGSETAN